MTTKTFRYLLVALFIFLVWGLSAYGFAPSHTIVKGLAQDDWSHNEDRATLGVSTWYAWGDNSCSLPCINMNRNWTLPQVNCYSTLLLGNEPNTSEPSGHPITATAAAEVTIAIKAVCPNMRLVATNIYMDLCSDASYPNPVCPIQWLKDYLAAYKQMTGKDYGVVANPDGRYDALGVHFYCDDLHFDGGELPAPCLDALQALEVGIPSLPALWVTETGVYTESNWGPWLTALALDNHIERVYAFTNRWVDTGWNGIDLVNADGTLTARGQAFRNWAGISYNTYMPAMGGEQGYP